MADTIFMRLFMCATLLGATLLGATLGATINLSGKGSPYVWDLQKLRLDAASVAELLTQKLANQYPTYNGIPKTNFDCDTKKMPGYYADVEAQCQVYHRCDINGNMTSYMCPNTTVFDQITLVCDYWYNVDCSRTAELEYFANRRLYQSELPLFDTPPNDYVAPESGSSSSSHQSENSGKQPVANGRKPAGPKSESQLSVKATVKPVSGGGQSNAKQSASGKNVQIQGKASISSSSNSNGQSQTEGDAVASAGADEEQAED